MLYSLFKKNSILMIGIFFMIFCLPYFYLIFYIHPSGDDYTYAFLEQKTSLLSAYIDEYNLWNGRFSSNIFVLKNPLTFGFNNIFLYRFIIFLIQFLLFVAFWRFIKLLFNINNSLKLNFITLILYSLYLSFLPALNEAFYWYTGVVTYQFSLILLVTYLSLYFRLNKLKNINVFILAILLLCIVGFNEIAMIYLFVFQFLCLVYSFRKKVNLKSNMGLFIIYLFGFSLVYFAPGNSVRESYFIGKSHQFTHSLASSILQVFRFIFEWNYNGLIFISAFISFYFFDVLKNKVINYSTKKYILGIPIIIFVLLFLSIFPAYWTTGIMGQHRSVNFALFFVLPLLYFWYIIMIYKLDSKLRFIKKLKPSYFYIVFVVLIFFNRNLKNVYLDIFQLKHKFFNIENYNRYQSINKQLSSKKKDVYLRKIDIHPSSIFIYDLTSDPNSIANIGYKRYWNVKGSVFLNQ